MPMSSLPKQSLSFTTGIDNGVNPCSNTGNRRENPLYHVIDNISAREEDDITGVRQI